MAATQRVAAILAGAAAASTLVLTFEGWKPTTYRDPVGIPTACAGVTKDVEPGRTYSEAECATKTATALVEHSAGLDACLPARLPEKTRGALVSFAFNVGTGAACRSTAVRVMFADPWRGCAELSRWVYATRPDGSRVVLPGLVTRRQAERAQCEAGLREAGVRLGGPL